MKQILAALVLIVAFSGPAFADDTQSSETKTSVKMDDVTETHNKVDGDIDADVTNAKLRAESGSKSKFSMSLPINYYGGAISHAFGADRPNLSGQPGQQTVSLTNIGIDGRYRWTKNDSITLGTWIGMQTPLQGQVNPNNQFDVTDPVLSYNRVDKLGPFQSVATISYGYGTSLESQSTDTTHEFTVAYEALHGFQNGLSLGMAIQTDYNMFSSAPGQDMNPQVFAPGYYGGDRRTQWDLNLYPLAEYSFNDRYSLRTVLGYFNWKHLYGDSEHYRLLQTFLYQSLGVGIAVTRDFYLYPNVQFVPNNLRSDFTNVALAATINIF